MSIAKAMAKAMAVKVIKGVLLFLSSFMIFPTICVDEQIESVQRIIFYEKFKMTGHEN